MWALKLSLVIFVIAANTDAARILAYYPFPSISHQVVFREITLELVRRGHNVTVITPDPMFKKEETPANLREIDVHDISYRSIKTQYTSVVTGKRSDLIDQTKLITDLPSILVEEQFKVKEVRDLLRLRGDEFDLLLLESYPAPALGLAYKFPVPVILVSSLPSFPGNYETIGGPTYWPVYPDVFRQRLYNLTLWEKAKEFYNRYRVQRIIDAGEEVNNEVLRKIFGPRIPLLRTLRNNVAMLILNVNPIWEGNLPVPPGVIHMGGLHQKPPKPLPKDLQNYLDESKNGVVYLSFGSNVRPSMLAPEKIAIFKKVLTQSSYNVIWKWDNENSTVESSNIKVVQWVPQADLLRHPNVKLFITQGGLQSTDEAITAGVPLIGIPMFGDQWYNSEKYVHHKIGTTLDLVDLTEDKLRTAIMQIVEDNSYRENIARLRALMQDQPQTPLQRGIWWIEYVLRHKGARHLRSPTANMSWSEFLELELVGYLLLGVVLLVTLIGVILKFVLSRSMKFFLNEELRRKIIEKINKKSKDV